MVQRGADEVVVVVVVVGCLLGEVVLKLGLTVVLRGELPVVVVV